MSQVLMCMASSASHPIKTQTFWYANISIKKWVSKWLAKHLKKRNGALLWNVNLKKYIHSCRKLSIFSNHLFVWSAQIKSVNIQRFNLYTSDTGQQVPLIQHLICKWLDWAFKNYDKEKTHYILYLCYDRMSSLM